MNTQMAREFLQLTTKTESISIEEDLFNFNDDTYEFVDEIIPHNKLLGLDVDFTYCSEVCW
jgi:hypothetical protein